MITHSLREWKSGHFTKQRTMANQEVLTKSRGNMSWMMENDSSKYEQQK